MTYTSPSSNLTSISTAFDLSHVGKKGDKLVVGFCSHHGSTFYTLFVEGRIRQECSSGCEGLPH